MKRTPVTSSTMRSVGYDSTRHALQIEFTSEAVYEYKNVPPDVHTGLMKAESKGTYFNTAIKDLYEFIKLG